MHYRRIDKRDRGVTKSWKGVGIQRGKPLRAMLDIFPATFVLGMDQRRRVTECGNASCLAALSYWINPGFDLGAHFGRPVARQF